MREPRRTDVGADKLNFDWDSYGWWVHTLQLHLLFFYFEKSSCQAFLSFLSDVFLEPGRSKDKETKRSNKNKAPSHRKFTEGELYVFLFLPYPIPKRKLYVSSFSMFFHVSGGPNSIFVCILLLSLNPGRVSAPKSDMPTVHFVSISHMWEAREHPDPWGHQLSTMVNRCSNRKGITWLFIDYMSLYQFERKSTREEDCFRAALRDMHTLYCHEVVEVEILEDLTPSHVQSEQASRKIPIFSTSRNKVVLVCITELTLNPTPHRLRGWCQAEKQWSLLRTLLEFIPMPPEEFRKVMHNLKFTHRDDSDAVFLLQKKVFLAKTASTTHLQLERPSPEDLALFRVALPHYKRLTHLVINGTHLTIEDAIAVVTSGAEDIQMESCHLASDAVLLAAKLTDKSAQHLKRLNLARNRIFVIWKWIKSFVNLDLKILLISKIWWSLNF